MYSVWFRAILATVPPGARVLEVGAGPGFLAEHARSHRPDLLWISSDLLAAPWNDVAANAQQLSFRSASMDTVVGLDVIHHLPRPGLFLAEAARILKPGGALRVLEPWVTPLSYPIYRWLHQEGCHTSIDPWRPFEATAGKDPWEGDAAIPWRLVRHTPESLWREMGLTTPRIQLMNAFAYVLSLGFREASLLPGALVSFLLWLDERSGALAPVLGIRALLTWERGPSVSSVPAGEPGTPAQ